MQQILPIDTQAHYALLAPCMHGYFMKTIPFAIYLACADSTMRLEDLLKPGPPLNFITQ